jgi:hypothetical protein
MRHVETAHVGVPYHAALAWARVLYQTNKKMRAREPRRYEARMMVHDEGQA